VALAYGSVSSPYSTYWTVNFGGLTTPSTVAVPEPSTWALMGLGLLGMAWTVRRNRRG
jgi:PEP-CTERM motif